jgi:transposase
MCRGSWTNKCSSFPSDPVRIMSRMDRESLRLLLAQGLSLAEIGKRFDRHESTIAYWVQKHGLEAVNREKHAARGALTREELEPLVEAGMTIRQLAKELGCSYATIRYWMMRHGLRATGRRGRPPAAEVQAAKRAGLARVRMRCPSHGETEHCIDGRGRYRCKKCRSDAVARRRRKVKAILVAEAGGRCCVCGYDRNMRALHFHHLDPSVKRHEINAKGVALALDKLRAEARKCVLLCSNCHAEVEDRTACIPEGATAGRSPG